MLLEKGADVNAQGSRYGKALQVVSSGGHKEIAPMLLEKGAEPSMRRKSQVKMCGKSQVKMRRKGRHVS
jgi:hypothetical protein